MIDPSTDDFIRRLVELRADVRKRQRGAGADHGALADRLDAVQLGMKVTANGTCYGSPIEMNVIEHRKPVNVTVYRPNGSSYRTRATRTEKPGTWFNPLIATLVAAGGRLLLSAAMRLVSDDGGSYVFCDTDSLFIAATKAGGLLPCVGGDQVGQEGQHAIRALSHEQVDQIVARFVEVNPLRARLHSRVGTEIERENFDPETGGAARGRGTRSPRSATRSTSLAQKESLRYWAELESDGALSTASDSCNRRPTTTPRLRVEAGRTLGGEHLLCVEFGIEDPAPDWFDEPAVGRLTVSSPRDGRV